MVGKKLYDRFGLADHVHYNHNAETYIEVGNALGMAMVELLEAEK